MIKKLFYGSFFLLVSVIFVVVLLKPSNNLIPGRMVLYTLIWLAFVCIMRTLFGVVENWIVKKGWNIDRISKVGFRVLVCLLAVALYMISTAFRTSPITDYQQIYNTSLALAQGQPVENWHYYAMYPYNLGTVSLLVLCMKGGFLLGMEDPYYFVLAVNVIQVMLVVWAVFYLAGLLKKDSYAFRWTVVFLFLCWTPVWAYTSAFYSDQLSFGGSIIGMALFCAGYREKKPRKWIWISMAGIFWALSVFAKVTAWIPFVAFVIMILLHSKKTSLWREILVFAAILFAISLGLNCFLQQFPSAEMEEQYGMPAEYEIVIGLLGDGTYGQQIEFVEECLGKESRQDRQEYCRQIIKDNWKSFFDMQRMAAKTRVIFGSGEIAPTALAYPYEENLLWNWFSSDGAYYWKYCCLSTGYFFSVLFLMILGAFGQLVGKKEENPLVFQSYLAVFGLIVFLLLWEAQNKQLYNHIPWMTMASGYGLEYLYGIIASRTNYFRTKRVKEE